MKPGYWSNTDIHPDILLNILTATLVRSGQQPEYIFNSHFRLGFKKFRKAPQGL